MKTFFDCIPCFVRQSLDSVRLATDDPEVHERVLRDALRLLSEMDMTQPPPAMGQAIHRLIRNATGVGDRYRPIKDRFNRMALEIYDRLAAEVEQSDSPLETAVRLAIAGNIIDFGARNDIDEARVLREIERAAGGALDGDVSRLAAAISQADDILYLADNAGELVFDKLVISLCPPEKVTVAVKGSPIINDATVADAIEAGLTGFVEVIDNGSDAPGTILADCSEQFRRRFAEADLVIAKGQGNYETLSDTERGIFFVLKAKCPVIARDLGCDVGAMVVRCWPGSRGAK